MAPDTCAAQDPCPKPAQGMLRAPHPHPGGDEGSAGAHPIRAASGGPRAPPCPACSSSSPVLSRKPSVGHRDPAGGPCFALSHGCWWGSCLLLPPRVRSRLLQLQQVQKKSRDIALGTPEMRWAPRYLRVLHGVPALGGRRGARRSRSAAWSGWMWQRELEQGSQQGIAGPWGWTWGAPGGHGRPHTAAALLCAP